MRIARLVLMELAVLAACVLAGAVGTAVSTRSAHAATPTCGACMVQKAPAR